jgi:hypothetical protein
MACAITADPVQCFALVGYLDFQICFILLNQAADSQQPNNLISFGKVPTDEGS